MSKTTAGIIAKAAAPTAGPSMLLIFGIEVPVLAFGLSVLGLLLARHIAPKSVRKLSVRQEFSLTLLLVLMLFLIVTGEMPFMGGGPLKVGVAFVWGVSLGLSGLVFIEFIGTRALRSLMAGVDAFFKSFAQGGGNDDAGKP